MEKIVSRLLIFSTEQFLDSYKESWDQTYFTTVPNASKMLWRSVNDRLQISFQILNEFKRINGLLFPLQ